MRNQLSKRDPKRENQRLAVLTICWVFVAVFVFTGCVQRDDKEVQVLDRGPDIETISAPPGYAAQAFQATGGFDAWTKTRKLQLDCVVTFYEPDGSFYLTEQRHEVYPWSNSIQISAAEPQGRFVWQLSNGQFELLEADGQVDELASAAVGYCFAESVLNIITAPARFLDESVEFTKETTPTKIQGQWYYPISGQKSETHQSSVLSPLSSVFYQDRGNSVVDMFWFACVGPEKFITVRGYDYSPCLRRGRLAPAEAGVEEDGVYLPGRIEIFRTDSKGNSQKRLVKIDYY